MLLKLLAISLGTVPPSNCSAQAPSVERNGFAVGGGGIA
jgi:hypothetical protein